MMTLDRSKLPPIVHPVPKDILDFSLNVTTAILALAEAKGLFTKQEFGDLLASNYDPETATIGEHLTAMFANAMQNAKTPRDIAEEMKPHLRLVSDDED